MCVCVCVCVCVYLGVGLFALSVRALVRIRAVVWNVCVRSLFVEVNCLGVVCLGHRSSETCTQVYTANMCISCKQI